MTDTPHPGLLPAGLADILPPDAENEARVTEGLVAVFCQFGYERVKPPLIEFEESLLSGSGAATAPQTFRLMDPISQRMLGLRADMTLQIARIAATRLTDTPRPLRLSYAGQVLRVKGSSLRPGRQFGQIGAELIGIDTPEADAEVIAMAANALQSIGVPGLSIDLGIPTLVPVICAAFNIDANGDGVRLRAALNQKDIAEINSLAGQMGPQATAIFSALLKASGPADQAMARIEGLDLPAGALGELKNLADVLECLNRRAPDLTLTIDPVEFRGYEYHTGVTFTFFAQDVRGELGRGGRYAAGNSFGTAETDDNADVEAATGVTLYLDSILRSLPIPPLQERLYLPPGNPAETADRLRSEGWIVVEGFRGDAADAKEAARLSCSGYWDGAQIKSLKDT